MIFCFKIGFQSEYMIRYLIDYEVEDEDWKNQLKANLLV